MHSHRPHATSQPSLYLQKSEREKPHSGKTKSQYPQKPHAAITVLTHAQPDGITSTATRNDPHTGHIVSAVLALRSQHRNANPDHPARFTWSVLRACRGRGLQGTSFGTTHGLAYASCKWMPLRHVNTDVFVSALRVVSASLRQHEF